MEKNLDVTKPRYSGQILPVLWPILISKSHCSYPKKTVNDSLSSWSEGHKNLAQRIRWRISFLGKKTSDDLQPKSKAFQEYSSNFRLTLYSTKTLDWLPHLRLQPPCQVSVITKIRLNGRIGN